MTDHWISTLSCSDQRPEQSIASARASVMIYDDQKKKWCPSGSSHGLSKVHIYHHFINSTFRVVGRKLEDHEVRTSANIRSCKCSPSNVLFIIAIVLLTRQGESKRPLRTP